MKHLGNVCGIRGFDIEPVDIVTFGSPCFPAGTLVLTEKGYEPIEDIKIGDKVFTHAGNWKLVSAIGQKNSKTVKMKGTHYGLITTPNHPFFSAEQGQVWNGNGYDRILKNAETWTSASEMQGKRWAVPNKFTGLKIPLIETQNNRQNDPPTINADLMYIIGRWLGDGWLRDGQRSKRPLGQTWGQIFICANRDKTDYLREKLHKVFNGNSMISFYEEQTVNKFRISNQTLCRWLKQNFGEKAYGKSLPAWALCMSEKMREALLQGYFDSDGYHVKENTWKATTVSKKLAHGLRLLGETLGYSCSVFCAEVPETTVIEGRTVNQRKQYHVGFYREDRTSLIVDGMYNWYRCKSVTSFCNDQVVYNITAEDDHSYVVEGFIVHNCQDMSIAGKRAGLKHEENGDDETTRSGLFMEAIRIIKEMREATNGEYPKFAIWENVMGAFSSNKGEDFRIVLEEFVKICEPKAVMPPVPEGGWAYADCYCGDGWSIGYRTLDSQHWGVPQRRRRIYLVLDLAGQRAGKVLFEREGLRGYFTENGTPWQNYTCNSAESIGTDNCSSGEERYISDVNGLPRASLPLTYDARGNGDGYTVNTITGDHENRITDYTSIVVDSYGIGNGQANQSFMHEQAATLNCMHDQQAVAIAYGYDCRNAILNEEIYPTLQAKPNGGQSLNYSGACVVFDKEVYSSGENATGGHYISEDGVAPTLRSTGHPPGCAINYIVRRLTPVECARLQGFPDWWSEIDQISEWTYTDHVFWSDVRNTHAVINGKEPKEYSEKQMQSWYNKLHTDTAEYRLWGNGIALPCALYVMQGIADTYED